MILILAAMKEELQGVLAKVNNVSVKSWPGGPLWLGKINGTAVVLALTGVGKVNAALASEYCVQQYGVSKILMVGIAGALNNEYAIGDVFVAEKVYQYDMDVTALGFPLGKIPYSDIHAIDCDTSFLRTEALETVTKRKIRKGVIITGDRFVSDKHAPAFSSIIEELQADAVDMESFSPALCSLYHDIPFSIVRIISDTSRGDIPKQFKHFLRKASACCGEVVSALFP